MIIKKKSDDRALLEVTVQELLIINNSLGENLYGGRPIPEYEFHTLIGAFRVEAKALHSQIHDLLKEMD